MFGRLSVEKEVEVPAGEAWELYGGGLRLAKFAAEKLPDLFHRIDYEEGDGGVGTLLKVTFPPGRAAVAGFREKYTMIDDERRVKETQVVEGGFLEIGFSMYMMRLEIIEKDEKRCITRSTIEYRVKEGYDCVNAASSVSILPMLLLMEAANIHLIATTTTATTTITTHNI